VTIRKGKYLSRNSFGTLVKEGQSECPSGPSPEGRPLAQEPAHDVEDPAEQVRAAGKRGGPLRVEDAAVGYPYVDELVEAVVEQDLGIEQVMEM
jgi:hypothetical protein